MPELRSGVHKLSVTKRFTCKAKVRVSAVKTITRELREAQAQRWGLQADVCGRPATWAVDGHALCLAHAGRRALDILMTGERA